MARMTIDDVNKAILDGTLDSARKSNQFKFSKVEATVNDNLNKSDKEDENLKSKTLEPIKILGESIENNSSTQQKVISTAITIFICSIILAIISLIGAGTLWLIKLMF